MSELDPASVLAAVARDLRSRANGAMARLPSCRPGSRRSAASSADYAALLRYLADVGFLDRKDGQYRRSGG